MSPDKWSGAGAYGKAMGNDTNTLWRSAQRVYVAGDPLGTPLSNVKSIHSIDQYGFFAVRTDGTLYRWGSHSDAETLPELVTGAAHIASFASSEDGESFACAVLGAAGSH